MTARIETLAAQLGEQLKKKHWKLATAESCTGGGLGFWLTSIPGSSEWYERGFITYSNEAKIEMLKVNAHALEAFGAVSDVVAIEMAEGAIANSHADISVAVTGIAGPAGGSAEKPVGTVWIGYAGREMRSLANLEVFAGTREEIRQAAIQSVIKQLLDFTN